jgi:hypothetical protein
MLRRRDELRRTKSYGVEINLGSRNDLGSCAVKSATAYRVDPEYLDREYRQQYSRVLYISWAACRYIHYYFIDS